MNEPDLQAAAKAMRRGKEDEDVNMLALIKGKERYVYLYQDFQRPETIRQIGRDASNPDLSFSWYDAAVLSQKIRQEQRLRQEALAKRF